MNCSLLREESTIQHLQKFLSIRNIIDMQKLNPKFKMYGPQYADSAIIAAAQKYLRVLNRTLFYAEKSQNADATKKMNESIAEELQEMGSQIVLALINDRTILTSPPIGYRRIYSMAKELAAKDAHKDVEQSMLQTNTQVTASQPKVKEK